MPTDKTEVSALYEREASVRCDREDVCSATNPMIQMGGRTKRKHVKHS